MRKKRTAALGLVLAGLVWAVAGGCGGKPDIESTDTVERIKAIHQAAVEDTDKAVDQIEKVAFRSDAATRREAASALGRMRSRKARSVLIDMARHEEDPVNRHFVVQTLGSAAKEDDRQTKEVSLEALKLSAKTDPDERVRAEAAYQIGEVGGYEDVQFLVDLMSDESVMVQSRAAGAIRHLIGIDFRFDSRADAKARRERIQVIREEAPRIARALIQNPQGARR